MNIIRDLEELLLEEKELEFRSFDENKALILGLKIIENAKSVGNVSIQIIKNEQLMFYYSMEGTSIDNQTWCERKSNVVKRFKHSSLYLKNKYLKRNLEFNSYLTLDSNIYQAKGGSLPLFIKGAGVVGSITVSGMADQKDHQLVVKSIKEIIKEEEL